MTTAFPLADAAVCADCSAVFSMRANRACPGCSSGEFEPVERFLSTRAGQAYTARTLAELKQLHAVNG